MRSGGKGGPHFGQTKCSCPRRHEAEQRGSHRTAKTSLPGARQGGSTPSIATPRPGGRDNGEPASAKHPGYYAASRSIGRQHHRAVYHGEADAAPRCIPPLTREPSRRCPPRGKSMATTANPHERSVHARVVRTRVGSTVMEDTVLRPANSAASENDTGRSREATRSGRAGQMLSELHAHGSIKHACRWASADSGEGQSSRGPYEGRLESPEAARNARRSKPIARACGPSACQRVLSIRAAWRRAARPTDSLARRPFTGNAHGGPSGSACRYAHASCHNGGGHPYRLRGAATCSSSRRRPRQALALVANGRCSGSLALGGLAQAMRHGRGGKRIRKWVRHRPGRGAEAARAESCFRASLPNRPGLNAALNECRRCLRQMHGTRERVGGST